MSRYLSPYSDYKSSGLPWVSRVPSHWQIVPVKRRFSIQLGKMLQNQPVGSNDVQVPYLKAQHVQWFHLRHSELPTMWASERDVLTYGVATGDLLVCEGGEGGRSGIAQGLPDPCIVQNALHRVRGKSGNSAEYLQYALYTVGAAGWLEAINSKATIAHFTAEKFGWLRLPIPPVEEQRAIARYCIHSGADINRLIRNKRRLIALLNEEKQAIIQQAVTRGLNPDVPLKPSGVEWLGEIPAHWELIPFLRCVSERADYRGATPEKVDNGVQLITARNIRIGWIDYESSKEFVRPDEYHKIMRRGLPKIGDILFTMEAPLGNAALVDREDIALAQRVVRFRMNAQKMLPDFALFSLLSPYFQTQLQFRATGSTASGIKASKLPQLIVACPPVHEQWQVVRRVTVAQSEIDQPIRRIQKEIDLIREYRTRLIADVVTGQLNVREAAASLPDLEVEESATLLAEAGALLDEDDLPSDVEAIIPDEDDAYVASLT